MYRARAITCEITSQVPLTYAIVHLIAVFLQVVLDAALEEVQLGLQLLREAEHPVLTPGQVGVVAQEAQPAGGGRRHRKS